MGGLAMGPKIWFRVHGVLVPWRPLPGVLAPPPLTGAEPAALDRLVRLALIGSGQVPLPGDVSLAHHGMRLLDELPECRRHVLEVLRPPLEKSVI
jgi:Magnesium chelatase, subunit ChlI